MACASFRSCEKSNRNYEEGHAGTFSSHAQDRPLVQAGTVRAWHAWYGAAQLRTRAGAQDQSSVQPQQPGSNHQVEQVTRLRCGS
jgi:hypothetical protein